jgi:hypothetical protein
MQRTGGAQQHRVGKGAAVVAGIQGLTQLLVHLFLLVFLFLLLINLHFSVALSELSEKNKRITQEIALLRHEIEMEDNLDKQVT